MAEVNGNIAVPGGQIGSGEAQVFNPAPTLQLLAQMQERADNQAKLDALAKMKQQEAEAKAKEVKPLDYPEFDVAGKGGLFNMKFSERRRQRHLEGLDAFNKVGNDPYKRAVIASEIRNRDAGENAMLEAQKERFYKTSEELKQQGYNFDPDREAYEITETSDLFDPTLNSRLIEKVKTNPNTFNYAQVGTEAEKLAGAVQEGTVDEQGRRMERKRAKFMRPSKSNPYIDEISVTDAVPILLQTPAGREQFPILVNQSLKKQGIDPLTIQGKDVSQLTDVEKGAYLKAQKEAIEPYFKGRGDYSFVQDFTTEEGKARQKSVGTRLGDVQIGEPSTNALLIRGADQKPSEAYVPNSVPLNSPKTPVGLPAGIVVYPTGYYGDNAQVTAGKMQGRNARVLKQNVTAKNFIEASGIPIARERIKLFNKNTNAFDIIEKDEVISQAINDPSLLKGIQGMYEKRNGYFAAPDDTQIEMFIDQSTGAEAFRRKGPSSTSLLGTVFIPEESAGSIRTHFGRKSKKAASASRIGSKRY